MRKKMDKRTIQKSGIWDICMVLCIMMILPVNISLLFLKEEQTKEAVTEKNVVDSDLEWQVLHELAAVTPIDFEKETLKAQAVILRTNILADKKQKEKGEVSLEQKKQGTWKTGEQEIPLLFVYKEKWGESYDKNCEKLFEAVEETMGMYLEENDEPVRVSYFRLSNGNTRGGEECLGADFSVFETKECRKDLLSKNYSQKTKMSGNMFGEQISNIVGKEITYEYLKSEDITYNYDSAGYVLNVQLGEIKLGGEVFRKIFGLPSSDFSITYEEKSVCIETKGMGSGIGFCQYGANEMAKEGKDFIDLLNYFFTNIAITKTE